MNTRTMNSLLRTSVGRLDDVDLVNRTLSIRNGSYPISFDVPRECEIVLNGERVKLHILQPMDLVRIVHGPGPGDCAAKFVEVLNRQHEYVCDRS
jgi:hypothetical protein